MNVSDPRALAAILEKAEADLAAKKHPDPYICVYLILFALVDTVITVLFHL